MRKQMLVWAAKATLYTRIVEVHPFETEACTCRSIQVIGSRPSSCSV